MNAVFVHGVPDTWRLWDEIRTQISKVKTHALALPGFDAPLPNGFAATKEEYVDWIVQQLETFREPVHLVGHDWGCILTARVVSLRPDLVKSWTGGDGPVSAEYEWHVLAKTWQTPGEGERWMKELDTAWFSSLMQQYGVAKDKADEVVSRIDDRMKDCILRLYRSAVDVGAEWESELANISSPGLIAWGKNDEPTPIKFAHLMAQKLRNSRVVELEAGHWPPFQCSAEYAAHLQEHWSAFE